MNDGGVSVNDGAGNTTDVGAGTISVAGAGNTITIDGGAGDITGLTNQTIDYPEFADGSGRAASEEQLSQVDGALGDLADTPDRKSTRLNSSHVRISYAVFCLKKKKKKNMT